MVKVRKGVKLPRRYPWKEWFSRSEFSLQRGIDFWCQTHGMAAMVRNRAYQEGRKVHVQIGEGGRIDVQVEGTKHA